MNLVEPYETDECNFYFMSLKNLDEMYKIYLLLIFLCIKTII